MNALHGYKQIADELEDFWGRRSNNPRFGRDGLVFGHPYRLLSNVESLLTVVDISRAYFSQAPQLNRPPFSVQLVVCASRQNPGPPPDSLFDLITYSGAGSWLMLHLGAWGHAHVDLAQGRAVAVLDPQLGARPDVVAHSLLNTILLNFCLYQGYALLHASCLVRQRKALLLMAPHNSGKSTTALHLIQAGFHLLTDSMVHISPFHKGQLLCGFPVGKIKLRRDVLARFAHLQPLLISEQVRDETKFTLNLRDLYPQKVVEQALDPQEVDLCLLTRQDSEETTIEPATETAVWDAVLQNSLFFDDEAVWKRNLAQITPLLDRARCYHLRIGRDPARITEAVQGL